MAQHLWLADRNLDETKGCIRWDSDFNLLLPWILIDAKNLINCRQVMSHPDVNYWWEEKRKQPKPQIADQKVSELNIKGKSWRQWKWQKIYSTYDGDLILCRRQDLIINNWWQFNYLFHDKNIFDFYLLMHFHVK